LLVLDVLAEDARQLARSLGAKTLVTIYSAGSAVFQKVMG
jgi:hypothetical protein